MSDWRPLTQDNLQRLQPTQTGVRQPTAIPQYLRQSSYASSDSGASDTSGCGYSREERAPKAPGTPIPADHPLGEAQRDRRLKAIQEPAPHYPQYHPDNRERHRSAAVPDLPVVPSENSRRSPRSHSLDPRSSHPNTPIASNAGHVSSGTLHQPPHHHHHPSVSHTKHSQPHSSHRSQSSDSRSVQSSSSTHSHTTRRSSSLSVQPRRQHHQAAAPSPLHNVVTASYPQVQPAATAAPPPYGYNYGYAPQPANVQWVPAATSTTTAQAWQMYAQHYGRQPMQFQTPPGYYPQGGQYYPLQEATTQDPSRSSGHRHHRKPRRSRTYGF
ncbi:hypothetical protein PENSPDRAFT_646703 [Peniophora sp. CONT]|nr:hypothetical protein PENSPDRAFT_646703 [Peniophora sp. CONT]